MIDGKSTGIDVGQFMRDMEKAGAKAAKAALKELAKDQHDLIEAGRTPDGGALPKNATSTRRRKKGKKPLVDTGILRDASQYRIRKSGDEYRLRPPAARDHVIYILAAEGYDTIFTELPPEFSRKLQEHIDKHYADIKAKAKR